MAYTHHPIVKNELVPCYKCGKFIYLITTIRTASGKRIPLDNDIEKIPHVCAGAMA